LKTFYFTKGLGRAERLTTTGGKKESKGRKKGGGKRGKRHWDLARGWNRKGGNRKGGARSLHVNWEKAGLKGQKDGQTRGRKGLVKVI